MAQLGLGSLNDLALFLGTNPARPLTMTLARPLKVMHTEHDEAYDVHDGAYEATFHEPSLGLVVNFDDLGRLVIMRAIQGRL